MTATQQGIANKLINEVIYLGQFERLSFNTNIINSPGPVQVPKRPLIQIPAVSVQMQEYKVLQCHKTHKLLVSRTTWLNI